MAETETAIEPKLTINPFDEDAPRPAKVAAEAPMQEAEKDPVIEEKDKKIAEEKPIDDKTDKPEAVPGATPKDIPARTEKEKEDVLPKNEIKFANETSEKIFNLLKEGKEDEVADYFSKKQVLKNIDKLPPAEIIKLQLKNENKDYTPQEIEDLFTETFTAPERPEQNLDETDAEFKIREDKYNEKLSRFERKIEREAKSSKAELLKSNQELVLPDIPKQELQPKLNEPTQEELDATLKARENYLMSIDGGLDNFKSIESTFKDKDVEIKAAYKISADERKELRATMESFNLEQFIQDRWLTKDGKFNTAQQAEDIFLLTKGKEATAKIVEQAVNKRMEAFIKGQKNVDVSGQARSGNFQPSNEEQMENAAKFFFSN